MSGTPILATRKSTLARALAVLGVAALAAGAILSIPRPSAAAERAPLDIALVDVSRSVVARAAGEWGSTLAARLGEWARRAESGAHDVAIVAFGRDVRTAFAAQPARALVSTLSASKLDPARDLLEPDGRAGARETRTAAALSLARTLAKDRPSGSITIFGDGSFTGEDPARVAHELALDGVTIALASEPPRAWNLALSPLEVARELEVGAPIAVTASVRVDRGTLAAGRARVDFEVRDAGGVRRKRVDFGIGDGEFVPLYADLGPARAGLVRIEAIVAFESRVPDALPEDDRSSAVLRCSGSLVVGQLGPESSPAPWHFEGVDVVAVERGELATRLAKLDALVTFDARPTPEEARLIRGFVEHGGGWLDLAGWQWIGARRQRSDPLRDLAALVPDPGSERPRDVIFLIDASGSMAGPPFAAVVAELGALVDSAMPADDVCVRFFAEDLSPPIRFGTEAERRDSTRRPALDEAVRNSRSPGGPTGVLKALRALILERAGSERDALLLLLSDGREPAHQDQESLLAALKQMRAAARLRVVAVAPVADADREFLTRVADSFENLADPSRWPAVFQKEILEREVVRRARLPVIPVTGGPEPAATLAASTPDLPPLDAAARAAVAAGAQVLWTDDRGTPLAAFARRGSGRVVSLAFTPGTDWAPAWRSADPLAPIVRALARSERSGQPRLRIEGEQLVLENVGADFPASARARIRVDSSDEIELTFDADARAPDAMTTRTAPIPRGLDDRDGIAFVHVDGGERGALELAVERPRAREFAFEPRRFVPPAPRPGTARANSGERSHPLAPPSLAVGVFALAAAALMGAFSARRR